MKIKNKMIMVRIHIDIVKMMIKGEGIFIEIQNN